MWILIKDHASPSNTVPLPAMISPNPTLSPACPPTLVYFYAPFVPSYCLTLLSYYCTVQHFDPLIILPSNLRLAYPLTPCLLPSCSPFLLLSFPPALLSSCSPFLSIALLFSYPHTLLFTHCYLLASELRDKITMGSPSLSLYASVCHLSMTFKTLVEAAPILNTCSPECRTSNASAWS